MRVSLFSELVHQFKAHSHHPPCLDVPLMVDVVLLVTLLLSLNSFKGDIGYPAKLYDPTWLAGDVSPSMEAGNPLIYRPR